MEEKQFVIPPDKLKASEEQKQPSVFTDKARVPIVSSAGHEDTNYVFSFGQAQSGKSVILASLFYYMSAFGGLLKPRPSRLNSGEAELLFREMLENLSKGILPNRTTVETVTNLNFEFIPNTKSKKVKPIKLTFLEMSGEDLAKVRHNELLYREIEDYLTSKIPITFFLVTPYDEMHANDMLIFSFLRKLESEARGFTRVNAILLITKWDKSGHVKPSSVDEFDQIIRERMPLTNGQLDAYELSKTYYTIGEISKDANNKDKLHGLNLKTAQLLTEWLYKSITGVDIHHKTFIETVSQSFWSMLSL